MKINKRKNSKGMIGWPIIFLMTVAVIAMTLTTIHVTRTNQSVIVTTAATRNSAETIANALVSLPECFAYEKDGKVIPGVLSAAKLANGEERKKCFGIGPVMWSITIVKFVANEGMTMKYDIGDTSIPRITIWKDVLVKEEDSTYAAKMIILVGHKNVNLRVFDAGMRQYEGVLELYEDSTFGPPIVDYDNEPYTTTGSKWVMEASIVNMTDMSEDCKPGGEELGKDNIKETTCRLNEFEILLQDKVCRFNLVTVDKIKTYDGLVEGCGIKVTAYLEDIIDRKSYEKVTVEELI